MFRLDFSWAGGFSGLGRMIGGMQVDDSCSHRQLDVYAIGGLAWNEVYSLGRRRCWLVAAALVLGKRWLRGALVPRTWPLGRQWIFYAPTEVLLLIRILPCCFEVVQRCLQYQQRASMLGFPNIRCKTW